MKVLIVEDNKILSNNISDYLALEKIDSFQLFEWNKVNYHLVDHEYDMIILDLWLPDIDGNQVCERIRESGRNIPILILTARNMIWDKIAWFKSGADDYLTKPFDYEELLVRIHALIRRDHSIKATKIELWDLQIHSDTKQVVFQNTPVHLSQLEFDLLLYLVKNRGKIISKETLLEKVWWEYDSFKMSRTVDVYIGYLRKKLSKDIIQTIRWEWYIIH